MAIPVSVADSVESIPKRICVCPSDYTNNDYDWGTDQYSSPLPAPSSPLPTSSPTLYETDDNANTINIDSKAEDVKPVESADEELGTWYPITFELVLTLPSQACLSKEWVLPIYVFFAPKPCIEYVNGHCVHIFQCAALQCKGKHSRDVRWFLDTGDARSTSGLQRHAKQCWGDETVNAADRTKDLAAVVDRVRDIELSKF
jgi:hypothetical protein